MVRTPAVILPNLNQPVILDEVDIQEPQAGEVLVRLQASGICHTDLAAVRDAREVPILLGHEGAGVVVAVGAGVNQVVEGDHVVINWQPKCGRCKRCQQGRPDLCENVTGTSTPRVSWKGRPIATLLNAGTFCEFTVVPVTGAVRIRRDLSFGEAALLGCAVATGVGAALFTAKIQPSETVVVLGTGGVGLNIVQGARLAGASQIVAVDLNNERLARAHKFGATEGINASDPELVHKIRNYTGGRGADYVFEVTGLPALMRTGVELLDRGGELVLVGAAARNAEFTFPPRRFMSNQQVIRGCIYGNILPGIHLPMFADWCRDGRLDVKSLITQTVSLQDVLALFAEPARMHGVRTIIEWPHSHPEEKRIDDA